VASGDARPSRSTRPWTGLVVLAAVLTLTAGSCDEESSLPLLTVTLPEATTISTTITCADAVRTLVDESDDEVRIRLRGLPGPDPDARCTLDVTLDEPLGGRLLVDGADGRGWRWTEGELKIVRLNGCDDVGCEVDWSLDDNADACANGAFLLASIGTVVGARGDSVVVVRRCDDESAVAAIDGNPYVWDRTGGRWFVQSSLEDACTFRTDAAPVSDEDCSLLGDV
jgi:hypothetical protein